MAKTKVVHVSGKRKTAIARATIKKGQGKVKINKQSIEIFNPELARLRLQEPIIIAGKAAEDLDITVNINGGGWSSQIEAARLAIAKGIVEYTGDKELEKTYLDQDRHFLVADTRRKERKKPMTHSRARAKRQKSYR